MVLTAFLTIPLLTVPFLGADWTVLVADDFFASVFAAADLADLLFEVLRVFPALLAAFLLGVLDLAMTKFS